MKKLSEIARKNAMLYVRPKHYLETIDDVIQKINRESKLGITHFELHFEKGFNFEHIKKFLLNEGFDIRIETDCNELYIGNMYCFSIKDSFSKKKSNGQNIILNSYY